MIYLENMLVSYYNYYGINFRQCKNGRVKIAKSRYW